MYKCKICASVSRPRETLKKHVVYRQDRSIEREVPVCGGCLHFLKVGVPFEILLRQGGKPLRVVSPRAKAVGANGFHRGQ